MRKLKTMFVHDGLKVISICHDVFEEDGIKMMVRDFVNVGEPLLVLPRGEGRLYSNPLHLNSCGSMSKYRLADCSS